MHVWTYSENASHGAKKDTTKLTAEFSISGVLERVLHSSERCGTTVSRLWQEMAAKGTLEGPPDAMETSNIRTNEYEVHDRY